MNDLFDIFNPTSQKIDLTKQKDPIQEQVQEDQIQIELEEAENNSQPNIQEEQPQIDINLVDNFQILHTKEEIGCIHEIYTPEDFIHQDKPKYGPAKEYPFKLDPFQLAAVKVLENYESVLVAAHTSAGKTAVAEYAIALAKRDKQRVVYTSPIKALSNQKYRELQKEFGDVGLVTGDVTINQNAFCLVMTTEILRSMLYRGSELIREVAWVIFDEVHYMRDRERGVVWEETIILLSQNVRYVFLSATIPNASEFAEWICRIKHQPCHVIYTEYRPVPLQHYICPSGSEGIYMVVDETGRFRDDKFQEAVSKLEGDIDVLNIDGRKKKKPTEGSDLFKLLKLIKERQFAPAIIFSFSKKEVEGYAMAMSKLDFTTPEEKEQIEQTYKSAMNCLSEEDRELPQIQLMLPILKKGIGIHHGGLLPIVKEIIEILFQEGYLKALFSTETFSMGLNMPSRTVVFTSVRKFDGEQFRWIGGGEYIQMSGRAGRRGIDEKGYCILIFDEKMDQEVAKSMLRGHSDPLNSSFHLSYNMLLNTLRIEDTDPEYVIRRSLHQFQNEKQIPEMKRKLEELNNESNQIVVEKESQMSEYFEISKQEKNNHQNLRKILNSAQIILPFLAIGRLVQIKSSEYDWGWGVYLNFMEKRIGVKKQKNKSQQEQMYIIDVMLHVNKKKKSENGSVIPCPLNEEGEMEVIPTLLENIYEISTIKLNLPQNLKTVESKQLIKQTLLKIQQQFKNSLPLLDPIKDMKVDDTKIDKLLEQKEIIQKEKQDTLDTLQMSQVEIDKNIENFMKKQKLSASIKLLTQQIESSSRMVLEDDLKKMKRVLRRMGYISKDEIVEMKGKVACEISACDEIMLTELIMSGLFQEATAQEIAALLTVLVFDENNANNDKFMIKNDRLAKFYNQLLEQAKKIFLVYQDCKINIEEKAYMDSFKPQLMDIALAWCQGSSFAQICKMTDQFEGSIIRCFRRLDELLKQLQDASKVIGNKELEQKFAEASKHLKRGIVFAASLYL